MAKTKILFVVFMLIGLGALGQYSMKAIPDPKTSGQDFYVSDPDGILGYAAVDTLNKLCMAIARESTAEVAIVAINDFEGASDFDFAYNLFNYWGIGKAANDNGLLLFIAKDRRKYQFVTGYGMEGSLPDVTLGAIGERYLVPKFKAGDYSGGVIDALLAIKKLLQNPDTIKELTAEVKEASFWEKNRAPLSYTLAILLAFTVAIGSLKVDKKTPVSTTKKDTTAAGGCAVLVIITIAIVFIGLFFEADISGLFQMRLLPWFGVAAGNIFLLIKYSSQRNKVINAYKDELNIVSALAAFEKKYWLLVFICPFIIFPLITYLKRKKRLVHRLQPPDASGKWIRLNRDEIADIAVYLDGGQQYEETLRTISYEIWQHADTGEQKLIEWRGKRYSRYEDCPKCRNRTLNKKHTRTIRAATYSASGLGEKIQDCTYCDYEQSFGTVVLPKLQKSSSSGSGSSGSSGSGSGSWGGGRSGGGGAGGSW